MPSAAPGPLQRAHPFEHLVPQQTPSTQKPLTHAPSDAHGAPRGSKGKLLPRSTPPSAGAPPAPTMALSPPAPMAPPLPTPPFARPAAPVIVP
jgi:hypothetical protein